jgi:hypothetical protein
MHPPVAVATRRDPVTCCRERFYRNVCQSDLEVRIRISNELQVYIIITSIFQSPRIQDFPEDLRVQPAY